MENKRSYRGIGVCINFLILLSCLLFSTSIFAQKDRDLIREGNAFFAKKQYSKAEVSYRKAISVNPRNTQAIYNLACTFMMQGKNKDAVSLFKKSGKLEKIPNRKAMSYHNLGVIFETNKLYDQAIDAYKEALRNNPQDDETRYNLALCQYLNIKNKGGSSSSPKGNSNQKKNQKSKKQQNKSQQNKTSQNDDQNKMSRDNAEQLLKAALQEEKKTQEKMNKLNKNINNKTNEKNW